MSSAAWCVVMEVISSSAKQQGRGQSDVGGMLDVAIFINAIATLVLPLPLPSFALPWSL